jgi:hypothetical protein
MCFYLDSVHASDPLKSLSKEIFKNEYDIRNKYLEHFYNVFFIGAVSSKCGRQIINVNMFMENVLVKMKELPTLSDFMEQKAITDVLFLVMKCLKNNCAFGGGESYEPAN